MTLPIISNDRGRVPVAFSQTIIETRSLWTLKPEAAVSLVESRALRGSDFQFKPFVTTVREI